MRAWEFRISPIVSSRGARGRRLVARRGRGPRAFLMLFGVLAGAPGRTPAAPAAPGDAWTLFNPTGRAYDAELVRLRLALPPDFAADRYAVLEDGAEVPYQAESIDGKTHLCPDDAGREPDARLPAGASRAAAVPRQG
jgi:hypothetical protein